MEVGGQCHDTAALTAKKERQSPLRRSLNGPQSSSGRFGEEKTLLPLPLICNIKYE